MSPKNQAQQEVDDFYIGYLDQMPARLSSWLRMVIAVVAAIGIAIALVLAINQAPFDHSHFEFGTVRNFIGTIHLDPAPHVVVARPGDLGHSSSSPVSRYLIVGFGKHGAASQLREFKGRPVSLRGTLIYRDHEVMIELETGSVEILDQSGAAPQTVPPVSLGEQTLRGEIVDSKCYFGVMKPGHGRPHRACASLCLRGGIPPVLVVDEDGSLGYYVVVTSAPILDFVAEPIEVTGEVTLIGDLRVLNAAPDAFVQL